MWMFLLGFVCFVGARDCLELVPCHEFNELEYFSYNSILGDYKYNTSVLKLFENGNNKQTQETQESKP